MAANLLAYSRENGVWAKSRSKARCQVPDGCWGLGTGDGGPGKPRNHKRYSGDLRSSRFARSESAARATVSDRRYKP